MLNRAPCKLPVARMFAVCREIFGECTSTDLKFHHSISRARKLENCLLQTILHPLDKFLVFNFLQWKRCTIDYLLSSNACGHLDCSTLRSSPQQITGYNIKKNPAFQEFKETNSPQQNVCYETLIRRLFGHSTFLKEEAYKLSHSLIKADTLTIETSIV